MKKIVVVLVFGLISASSIGQDVFVAALEVKKGYPSNENNQSLVFELGVFSDVSNFTYKLDNSKSVLTKVEDDTGFDLLSEQVKYEKQNEARGYGYQKMKMEYRGPLSGGDKTGIRVESRLGVVPQKGAKSIKVQGVIAMINVAEDEHSYTLKDIPTKSDWGAPGVQTDMGEVKISENGYMTIGEVEYVKYEVKSDRPITSVQVIDGDDREEAKKAGIGLYGNEIVFKKAPEQVTLNVVVKDIEIKEIPFDVELSIGF